jgi:hypothetical protein
MAYDSGDWLVSVTGGVDFRTVEETLYNEDGSVKTESVLIDPDGADTEANRAMVPKTRLRGQYQIRTGIQLMRVTIGSNSGVLSTDVTEMRSGFSIRVGPQAVQTYVGQKKFMLVAERKVAEDHRLGILVTQQEWVYYDRWRDCPASWKMIGPVQEALEQDA